MKIAKCGNCKSGLYERLQDDFRNGTYEEWVHIETNVAACPQRTAAPIEIQEL